MTKKEQHEFFLKEIQPYVDIKVKEARQEEAEEIWEGINKITKGETIKNLGNGVVEHLIIMDKDKFEKLKQKRIK